MLLQLCKRDDIAQKMKIYLKHNLSGHTIVLKNDNKNLEGVFLYSRVNSREFVVIQIDS